MEETCEILDHAEILKGFITNANYEGFKAYIESDEVDIRTINSLVGGSILLFFSEIHSEIHSNHNGEDMKNIIKMYELLLESPFVDVNYRDVGNDTILKIILVSSLILVAIICIPIVSMPGNKFFKHALEWDYFLGVITFYLLTYFMWKKNIPKASLKKDI